MIRPTLSTLPLLGVAVAIALRENAARSLHGRLRVDPNILDRVARGNHSALRLRQQTHTAGYAKAPRERLSKAELALNAHNAKAERDYCARLLIAGRRGLSPVAAHWWANESLTQTKGGKRA